MFEAKLSQGGLLKKVVEAVKELVNECNIDCNDSGLQLQAMDSSHVALVALILKSEGFEPYRCDRNITLGVSITSLNKLLKCANNDDVITLKSEDDCQVLSMTFESPKEDRVSEYDLKLMDIDIEHLGLPDTKYDCTVSMSSGEFQRICRDLGMLSENISIEIIKSQIKFSAKGEFGNGSVTLKQGSSSIDDNDSNTATVIDCEKPVNLTFSVKYLTHFAKAASISNTVTLSLTPDVPILVQFNIGEIGHLQYYLAPKIDDQ
ncbi:proliferating cell nuclear antigen [Conidiobolus coronatus NRRL 28638]|jgi:proliferating cell nuclear antigen|uniref:DNA sliding clamp PCNA n=1 Tax=Conidiobolus coronatus (strain ATCC 28846 / CBS 209.66 / NRRL 28638) TaxID=796925 RepID=A0A137PIT2_CONC2|nr:proliferating cell nuclear antigen [Conidiobolus coronatus NRRL 28638]|eukprot:KXN74880.1 proliferating cell nuclear antigen [Conidiobolus coronatus NRRL 28638]